MRRIITALIVVLAVVSFYVRWAPVDPARWHVSPQPLVMGDQVLSGGFASLRAITTAPETVLKAFDQVASQTPRTVRIAGSVDEGMMTYQTRSRVFGFPDYTTVAIIPAGGFDSNTAPLLSVQGRLRFSVSDMGVNAARVKGWLAALGPLTVAP